jgi:hypothetical protein
MNQKNAKILTIALIPTNVVGIFWATKLVSGSEKTAWRMLEITGGVCIVVWLAIFLGKKLNKPK